MFKAPRMGVERTGLLSPSASAAGLGIGGAHDGGEPSRDSQEVIRRHAEWEREVESLDKREAELHASQLRLIRDQTAVFINDLTTLQQEVASLKGDQPLNAEERLQYVEEALRGEHGPQPCTALALQEPGGLEERMREVEQAMGSQFKHQEESFVQKLDSLLQERDSLHISLTRRLEYVEHRFGDNGEKHAKAMEGAEALAKSTQSSQASLAEKVGILERSLGGWEDEHNHLLGRFEAFEAAYAQLETQTTLYEKQHTSVMERLNGLGVHFEQVCKDLTAEQPGMEGLKADCAKVVAQVKQVDAMAESLKTLEEKLAHTVDRHAKNANHLEAKVECFSVRISACEAHGTAIESLRKDCRGHFNSAQRERGGGSSPSHLAERVGQLEKQVHDRLAKEMASAQSKLEKLMHTRGTPASPSSAAALAMGKAVSQVGDEGLAALQHRMAELEATSAKGVQSSTELREHVGKMEAMHMDNIKACLKALKEEIDQQGTSNEAHWQELRDLISKERHSREQVQHQSGTWSKDAYNQESFSDLAAQDWRVERDMLNERLDSLQRTVNIFDGVMRKEMEERSKENRRVWDAIDSHTHDLSTQVLTGAGSASVAGDEALPSMPAIPLPSGASTSAGASPTGPLMTSPTQSQSTVNCRDPQQQQQQASQQNPQMVSFMRQQAQFRPMSPQMQTKTPVASSASAVPTLVSSLTAPPAGGHPWLPVRAMSTESLLQRQSSQSLERAVAAAFVQTVNNTGPSEQMRGRTPIRAGGSPVSPATSTPAVPKPAGPHITSISGPPGAAVAVARSSAPLPMQRTGGSSVSAQAQVVKPPTEPVTEQPASPGRHVERVSCGHTRYPGSKARSADIHVD